MRHVELSGVMIILYFLVGSWAGTNICTCQSSLNTHLNLYISPNINFISKENDLMISIQKYLKKSNQYLTFFELHQNLNELR